MLTKLSASSLAFSRWFVVADESLLDQKLASDIVDVLEAVRAQLDPPVPAFARFCLLQPYMKSSTSRTRNCPEHFGSGNDCVQAPCTKSNQSGADARHRWLAVLEDATHS
jgi:hypothetical protein